MLLGLCTSAISSAKPVAAAALDYVEENVQSFLAPESPVAEFEKRLGQAAACARNIAAACCFLPGTHKCTGPQVDETRLLAYAGEAFRRARRSGIDTIVFGSGGARALAEGFPVASAVEQFATLLAKLGPLAARHGVTVVVEPLNRGECNFINTLDEGAEVVRRVDHPNVRLLADLFHMLRNDETPDAIRRHGDLLAHTHIAEKETRSAPGVRGDDFRPFLKALRAAGYDRRMSLECSFTDLAGELPGALKALRTQLADAGY
jgi:sugar phosphate isomerase/epimerase